MLLKMDPAHFDIRVFFLDSGLQLGEVCRIKVNQVEVLGSWDHA